LDEPRSKIRSGVGGKTKPMGEGDGGTTTHSGRSAGINENGLERGGKERDDPAALNIKKDKGRKPSVG